MTTSRRPPAIVTRTRLQRALWRLTWLLLASWTPRQLQPWRRLLLVLFGARMGPRADARGSARIWLPRHLSMDDHAVMAGGVQCRNEHPVHIGRRALISQRAHLHAAHEAGLDDGAPIRIGAYAWVAAEAFVGPGSTLGDGVLLGARSVCAGELDPWTVYAGNPARALRPRRKTMLEQGPDGHQPSPPR